MAPSTKGNCIREEAMVRVWPLSPMARPMQASGRMGYSREECEQGRLEREREKKQQKDLPKGLIE